MDILVLLEFIFLGNHNPLPGSRTPPQGGTCSILLHDKVAISKASIHPLYKNLSILVWLKYLNLGWVTWCRQYSCSNRKIGHEAGGRNGEG